MRYLKLFTRFNESVLLDLKDNQDHSLISEIKKLCEKGSNILEISCGNASDALYLKNIGYNITCTEINDDYINNAINLGLNCIKHDTSKPFPFNNKEFDLVYCRLGLHYFNQDQLSDIFNELQRISNYLIFTVKLVNDIPTGKVIFTKDDWDKITENNFNIISSKIKEGILYNNQSKWLEIIAKSK